ncbi:MAG: radical SAM protein [Streptococcaceae bacterium]|nr:radical SAM protein [Streptococcaceae bacterium]
MDERLWQEKINGIYISNLKSRDYNIVEATPPYLIGFKITENCNQYCKHCWAGKNSIDMNLVDIKLAFDKISELSPLHFTITGGEAFVREDVFEIIEHAIKLFPMIEIFTNATLLDEVKINKLSKLLRKQDYLQISFDGLKNAYNIQRGANHFDILIKNIKILVAHNINIRLHMTVTEYNISDMLETYKLARLLKVDTFSITSVFPIRKGKRLVDGVNSEQYVNNINMISKLHDSETMTFRPFIPIKETSKLAKKIDYTRDILSFNDDILHWVINSSGEIYHYLDHYLYEELRIGNIHEDSVSKLLKRDLIIQKRLAIRNLKSTSCEYCSLFDKCRGGNYIFGYPNIDLPDRRCSFAKEKI